MRKLLIILATFSLVLSPVIASAAIARDTYSGFKYMSGSNPYTSSYTVTGSNTFLYVALDIVANSTPVSVLYGLQPMTLIDSDNSNVVQSEGLYTYGLEAPATGSQTLTVTLGGSVSAVLVYFSSYTGVSQTGQPEAHATSNSASTASISQAVTVLTSGAWLTGFFRTLHTGSAGSNTLVLGAADNENSIDSNGSQSTGSQSMTVTQSPAAGAVIFVVSLAPYGAAPAVIQQAIFPQLIFWQ